MNESWLRFEIVVLDRLFALLVRYMRHTHTVPLVHHVHLTIGGLVV
jgi:hypothetical protein